MSSDHVTHAPPAAHAPSAPTGRPRSRVVAPRMVDTSGSYAREVLAMGSALAAEWRDVFRAKTAGADLLAGLTVAAVALPLNLALAVASGVPPIAGLVAGAIGGVLAGVFGGASLQVTGPAAALNVMVLAVAKDFGPVGVAAAALFVGVVQIALAFALAGRVGKLIPESVLAGFTTGVGVKLLDQQLPELLGFDYKVFELAQMMHRPRWLHEVSWLAAICGIGVAFIVVLSKQYKRFPAALVAVSAVTALSVYLNWNIERVGAVPSSLPAPSFPLLPDEKWLDLAVAVLPLALLASVESLLSAQGIARMTTLPRPTNTNLELAGQGIANVGVGLLSGMPVTGVIVRSGVNVQSGAKTRLSSIVHGLALLSAVLFLSKTIEVIPLAALAGMLCVVAFRLIEVGTLVHLYRENRLEAVAFGLTAAGTVTGHLVTGLAAGLAVHWGSHFLRRKERAEQAQIAAERRVGVRATLGKERALARREKHYEPLPTGHEWLDHVTARARVPKTAFIHPQATLIGEVVLGESVHIAAGSSVRADEGTPFFIGDGSNVQDGVVIHALKDKRVLVGGEGWAVYVGRNVSMAHDALVHGPCYVGDNTFIGFKAVVHDSVVGSNCFVGIGAVVVGVEVPDGKFVPHGTIVASAEDVAALPDVTHAQAEFNADVVEVNRGLAAAYHTVDDKRRERLVRLEEPRRRAPAWAPSWDSDLASDRF